MIHPYTHAYTHPNTHVLKLTHAHTHANTCAHAHPQAMLWHTDGGWMAPDAYWNNLDWLTYVYEKSPMAAHVVSCNSMGVG